MCRLGVLAYLDVPLERRSSREDDRLRVILYKRLAAQKHHAVFFANSISATRLIMNQLFVVVLSRFRILVRVGPERRGATNKYLW